MRLAFLIVALLAASSTRAVHAQSVIFSDGFENGLAGWNATGLWHLQNDTDVCGATVAPFPEGHRCAYYGIDNQCNYDTGGANAGVLVTANPIAIPTGFQKVSLRCWMLFDIEPCDIFGYDFSYIEVSANNGASWTTLGAGCVPKIGAAPDAWNPRGIDLSGFAGQSILVRFTFDSVDDFDNSGLGVLLDRFVIQGETGTPFCTSTCPCEGPVNYPYPLFLALGGYTGCGNSAHLDGQLAGDGIASVSNDTLTLRATDLLPHTIAMLVQGTTSGAGAFSGEGRGCVTGTLTRMGFVVANNGVVTFPSPGASAISVAGFVPPSGGTRTYQVRYRDISSTYCNPTNFNWTNGYAIAWAP